MRPRSKALVRRTAEGTQQKRSLIRLLHFRARWMHAPAAHICPWSRALRTLQITRVPAHRCMISDAHTTLSRRHCMLTLDLAWVQCPSGRQLRRTRAASLQMSTGVGND